MNLEVYLHATAAINPSKLVCREGLQRLSVSVQLIIKKKKTRTMESGGVGWLAKFTGVMAVSVL